MTPDAFSLAHANPERCADCGGPLEPADWTTCRGCDEALERAIRERPPVRLDDKSGKFWLGGLMPGRESKQ